MKKRIIAALVLALVLLLVIPAALAAEPDGTARFYLNGTQYRVEPDGESGQIVLAWNDEDGDWSEEPTSLPTGVSYDLKSNTLTLNGAQLETADFRYTLAGDDGMEYWLPKANLTIKLVGENSISLSPSEIDPDQSYHALAFGGRHPCHHGRRRHAGSLHRGLSRRLRHFGLRGKPAGADRSSQGYRRGHRYLSG